MLIVVPVGSGFCARGWKEEQNPNHALSLRHPKFPKPPPSPSQPLELTVNSDVSMLPRVGPFSTMKLRRPVRIVDTDQAGFQVSGWKSVMERHNLKKKTKTRHREGLDWPWECWGIVHRAGIAEMV